MSIDAGEADEHVLLGIARLNRMHRPMLKFELIWTSRLTLS